MHVAIALLTLLASLKWADWKNWRTYHASMFFIATGGLLYEFMVKDYSLWKFHPDILYGKEMVVIIYALITMPVSILIFLSHFPEKWSERVFYILIWSGIYIVVEWVMMIFGRISYSQGWHIWFSFLFDIIMFSIIALHQRYPFWAYLLSVGFVALLIKMFKVPFNF
ncbi:hypothetical protein PU629_18445 [Pullulanibacillus sp. KACC 23026]|uniref:CBO0543 family protein n=1 Tax=Pullulanibacillus sp. KACC 23026 TaxID=3028315 RepID=UPI0023AEFF28|nr:CBO0543 family protein [Pullulanibacillus sp. KACC 23026]WEG12080.1 hypothetical protein PU629_18445 [Pullulanibacillus sp. KACC 23026]